MQLEKDLFDLGRNNLFRYLSEASVFLQTGHSCLGTLNCPSLMVQEWASYHFKDVWSLFPSRAGAICTGEMLVIYQGGVSLGDTGVFGFCLFPKLASAAPPPLGDYWGKAVPP